MFVRFHAMREERDERGFTLIELLVVILIIAILAAIAIPVFLRQREKGYVAAVESALKNAATAEESFATGSGGSYTAAVGDQTATPATPSASLADEGFKWASEVTPAATVNTGASAYCVSATHARLGTTTWGISNISTTPRRGTCSTGVFTAAT
jgi:type IV pilus assembly protein PilA